MHDCHRSELLPVKLKTDEASTQHQLGKSLAPQGLTHHLKSWLHGVKRCWRSHLWLSDKIICSATFGPEDCGNIYHKNRKLSKSITLPCRADLLLAVRFNLPPPPSRLYLCLFLVTQQQGEAFRPWWSPNWFRWHIPVLTVMVRLLVCCVSFSRAPTASGRPWCNKNCDSP